VDDWTNIRWTEAGQIADLMELPREEVPEPDMVPRAFYLAARRRDDLETALSFLAHALPRYDAVAWAARVLERLAAAAPPDPSERQALDHALRWIEDPSDEHRRAAFDAAESAAAESPERLLALAVFLAGGSLAPADLPAVLPEASLGGRFAACALIAAAHRSGDPNAALAGALDLGEKIAEGGVEALPPR